MPVVNARQYRETVYRLRSHPSTHQIGDFHDQRDSLFAVYASVVPFVGLEYLSEASTGMLPSGVIFPLAYLLFWAFYYTYYKPGFLEEKLGQSKRGELSDIAVLLVGVLIWFVKVTFVELTHFLFTRWMIQKPTATSPRFKNGSAGFSRARYSRFTDTGSFSRPHKHPGHEQYRKPREEAQRRPAGAPEVPKKELPRDIQQALTILGIPDCREWREIHRQYRMLAKKFHPDLNPEVTATGQRFMLYDAAFKKLSSVKAQYFPEKR